MIVIPAIDIKGGKVVRLMQGAAEHETVYSDSPVEIARKWESCGAQYLHVVDLDGAIEGKFKNLGIVKDIVNAVKAKVGLGGGLRDAKTIKDVLDAGVDKVVIGTKALDEKFLKDLIDKFKDRIAVGVDAKDGIVYTKGWLEKTSHKALELVKRMEKLGVKTINYTDISRDGMMEGPNLQSLKELLKITSMEVIAAGGITNIEDVKRLKKLEADGLKGMIIGKALYENTIDLREAIRICSERKK